MSAKRAAKAPEQELSVAAAEDMVAYYRQAIDRTDRKLKKQRGHVEQTEAARARFVASLEAAEDELAAAKERDVEAAAGVAEGSGGI